LPAKGAHLAAAPREIRLTFTEAPELPATRIELIGPDGKPLPLAALHAVADSAQVIVARIMGPLGAGAYSVRWQIAGKDGHPVRDRFSFTIVPGAAGLEVAADARTGPAGDSAAGGSAAAGTAPQETHHDPASLPQSESGFDAESPLYAAIRWLTFAGILLILGAVSFHLFVLGSLRRMNTGARLVPTASARAASIGGWAAVALLVVTLLRLYAQSFALHGAEQALNADLLTGLVRHTAWGRGWLLQIAAVVISLVAFRAVRRGSTWGWPTVVVAALMLAVTPALSGHAASAPRLTSFAILTDTAHVVGAGGWMGSLAVLLAAGIPSALLVPDEERGPAVAGLVNAFSPTALVFAGISAATGVFAAWLHLGTVSALWQSDYGRTLLIKVAVLSVVAGTGAYNWRRVKPTLGDAAGTRRIRRSATVEVTVAVLVLAVTAVLVATPPPATMAGTGTEGSASMPPVASPDSLPPP
jgi:putative copper export protein/methionine-rich copper-binding protein CopC